MLDGNVVSEFLPCVLSMFNLTIPWRWMHHYVPIIEQALHGMLSLIKGVTISVTIHNTTTSTEEA